MIMVAAGCDAEGAFGVLRKYSSHKNVKVNEMARRMVESVSVQPHTEDHACHAALLGFLDGLEQHSGRSGT